MGLPVPEARPGDCYVWGACEAAPAGRNACAADPGACGWQRSDLPVVVADTTHLDVREVGLNAPCSSRPTWASLPRLQLSMVHV